MTGIKNLKEALFTKEGFLEMVRVVGREMK
jgi:hypothetical protein